MTVGLIFFATPSGGWREQALCKETDPELFFPPKGRGDLVRKAKAVCTECPVREACLDEALDEGYPCGVWGGLTERERRPRRKARANADVGQGEAA